MSMRPDLTPHTTALLLIDMQDHVLDPANHPPRPSFYARAQSLVLPNTVRLLKVARQTGVEVIYTVMENLTRDGRERSLDYKLSGFNIPKGSPGARVARAVAPVGDDIVLRKSSACLYHSTNFDYVVRNMGITTVLCTGFLTDQCVEQTMKAGAARSFRMICVEDACAANTDTRHDNALARIAVTGRIMTTDACLEALRA